MVALRGNRGPSCAACSDRVSECLYYTGVILVEERGHTRPPPPPFFVGGPGIYYVSTFSVRVRLSRGIYHFSTFVGGGVF